MKSKKSIACIAHNGRKVFIAHRLPKGDMGGKWEFPGGKVEEGEECGEAIKREMKEEFNVEVEALGLIAESRFMHRGEERLLLAYETKFPDNMDTEHLQLTEHSECKWVDIDEIEGIDFVDSDKKIYPIVREAVIQYE